MDLPHDAGRGGIRIDPAQLSRGADAVEIGASDMQARRAEIGTSVEVLLASWRGESARRFAQLWEDWRSGADEVIAGLAATAGSLRSARDEIVTADADRADGHVRLQGRLHGRLG